MLDEHGVNFKMGVMYRTVSNDFRPDEKFDYDMLVFFSPNGIASLQKNFPNFEQGSQLEIERDKRPRDVDLP